MDLSEKLDSVVSISPLNEVYALTGRGKFENMQFNPIPTELWNDVNY